MTGTIEVEGVANLLAEPEVARVRFIVASVKDTRAAALAETKRRAVALDKVFAASAVPTDDRHDGPYLIHEEHEYEEGTRYLVGYRASRHTELVIDEWSALAELLSAAVDRADASVAGPWFELLPGSDAYDEARREAAREARRRAATYCSGLGIELGAVVEVREPGLGGERRGFDDGTLVQSAMMDAAAHLEPEPELAPGRLPVGASVIVRFALADRT